MSRAALVLAVLMLAACASDPKEPPLLTFQMPLGDWIADKERRLVRYGEARATLRRAYEDKRLTEAEWATLVQLDQDLIALNGRLNAAIVSPQRRVSPEDVARFFELADRAVSRASALGIRTLMP